MILLLSLAPWFIWSRRVSLSIGGNLNRILCSISRMLSVNPLHIINWIMNPDGKLSWLLILLWLQLDLSYHRKEMMESTIWIVLVLSDHLMLRAIILRWSFELYRLFYALQAVHILFLGSTTSLWRWMLSISRIWLTTQIPSLTQPSTNG